MNTAKEETFAISKYFIYVIAAGILMIEFLLFIYLYLAASVFSGP